MLLLLLDWFVLLVWPILNGRNGILSQIDLSIIIYCRQPQHMFARASRLINASNRLQKWVDFMERLASGVSGECSVQEQPENGKKWINGANTPDVRMQSKKCSRTHLLRLHSKMRRATWRKQRAVFIVSRLPCHSLKLLVIVCQGDNHQRVNSSWRSHFKRNEQLWWSDGLFVARAGIHSFRQNSIEWISRNWLEIALSTEAYTEESYDWSLISVQYACAHTHQPNVKHCHLHWHVRSDATRCMWPCST